MGEGLSVCTVGEVCASAFRFPPGRCVDREHSGQVWWTGGDRHRQTGRSRHSGQCGGQEETGTVGRYGGQEVTGTVGTDKRRQEQGQLWLTGDDRHIGLA